MASNPHYDHGLLWRALAVSLLLHAVLLLQPGPGPMSSRSSTGPSLLALLRPKALPPSTPAAAKAPPAHAAPAAMLAREVPAAAAREVAVAAPPQQGMAETVAAPTGSAGTSSKAYDNSTAAAASAGDAGLDFAEAQKSYVFALAAEARRVRKYPPRALSAGWTGTAQIRVTIKAGGNAQAPQLQKSSDYVDIDNAALSFVGIALKRTPVPENLRSRNFDFILPVSFTINDE
ncbi:energy transducer TonB [Georgfuchsia toluolica]|nr:energy transducer TonB [Georgfuchsia toluolica]